ncbi:MAG: YdeI/OmpD-associated family protein [Saprospiraceae bacterium]|nr:YdeI/OmpD-associated family protein [Saprospiraceae bacterium]
MKEKISEYILNCQPFAQEILYYLRDLIHVACPQVEEKIKWSFPHFDYHGTNLCSIAGFKKHCSFGFWIEAKMSDPDKIFKSEVHSGMGHLGKIESIKDLPNKNILIKYIHEAMNLIDAGEKLERKTVVKKKLILPEDFQIAIMKNKKAQKIFLEFSYSQRKEYLEWITEAKTEPTRVKRMNQAIEWIAEGKGRNWKYEKSR